MPRHRCCRRLRICQAPQILRLHIGRRFFFHESLSSEDKEQHSTMSLNIAVVRECVSVTLLKSRKHTSDVDYFHETLSSDDTKLLRDAIRKSCRFLREVRGGWYNDHTVFVVPIELRQELTRLSIEQNNVMFDSPQLQLFAAL
jgi:hypothetical protein